MRNRYEQQLLVLNNHIAEMCNMCENAIELSVGALFAKSESECADFAEQVYNTDREIDNAESEIEKICISLIVRQQPVASDLRVITAALRMISDLERIGDQSSDIAELSQYIQKCSINHKIHLKDMSKSVIKMLRQSISSFTERDLQKARDVYAMDDEVDALFEKVKRELISIISKDDTDAELCVDLLMVSKYFERIGDHAENIAQWVEYAFFDNKKIAEV